MEIFLLAHEPYSKAEKMFLRMVNSLKNVADHERLIENKFRLIEGTRYVGFWNVSVAEPQKKKNGKVRYYTHPVTFGITIDAKRFEIKEIDLIDDMFGQPHSTNVEYNQKIKNIIDGLITNGVLVQEDKK